MKSIFYLVLLLFFSTTCFAQNTIGLPEIINYSKKAYGAGTQSWDIEQDKDGIMYFANNDGLLTFDGNYWKTYTIPNKTIIRSLEIINDRIYIGAQDELGYFSPDSKGSLVYTSLKNLIPQKERSFADVWDVIAYNNHLFFRTSTKIFQFSNNKVSISYSTDWRFMGLCNGNLVVQDNTNGLLKFKDGMWEPLLKQNSYSKDFLVTSFFSLTKDTAMVTTLKNGVFYIVKDELVLFETPALNNIATKLIYKASVIDNDRFLLATKLEGCYIIDKNGNLVQSFSRFEGLQNNNILSIFFDRDKNLWLGLDNGIDFIAYDSPIKHIYPSPQNEGSGYASIISNNKLYIGTSNGLYTVPLYPQKDLSFIKGTFEPVANTRGQVWNLSEVNGQLLLGHHEGAFMVNNNNTATLLDNVSGYWTFLPYYNVLPSPIMVTGTYNGIRLFNYKQPGFVHNLSNANFESARFITVDNNDHTIWVAHPYKGLYKVQFNQQLNPVIKQYTTKNGLRSINNNYIFKVKNRIVATTEDGIYEYNNEKDIFEPSPFFASIFNKPNIRYLKEDATGNIWFVHDKRLGVVEFESQKSQVIYLPELTDKFVNGFEYIYPVDSNNILIGGEKGFFHINYDKYKNQKNNLQVHIRSIKTFGKKDSLLFGGYNNSAKTINLKNIYNSLRFEFSSTSYGQDGNVEYSYILKGLDKKWSSWTKRIEKEYTHLPHGTYTFEVKARNTLGVESTIDSYTITILPPWYHTYWAYALYTLILFATAYYLYIIQKKKFAQQQKKHEEEQKRLLYLHQLELEKTEKEIIRLKNEKLEAEIEHKNTELASSAMHLVQKGELLTRIKEEMVKARKNVDEKKTTDDFKKIIKILNEEDKMDEDWEHFAMHFDKVHRDFLTDLKHKYPNLTPNELKLSAYLRMNLSSKEVAQLMNISVRGVEISRYRLRKKLGIPTETNLFDFLMTI